MNFQKFLSKLGMFCGWVLLLPVIIILDVLIFLLLPFMASEKMLSDEQESDF